MPRKKVAKKVNTIIKTKTERKEFYKGSAFIGFVAIVLLILVFLVVVYSSLQKVQSDVFNVREVISEQQKFNLQEIKDQVKQEELENKTYLYLNRRLGIKFEIPAGYNQEEGVIEDNGILMFGPIQDLSGVKLPKFTLRIFEKTNLEDYKKNFYFADETCGSANSYCLMFDFNYTDLSENRVEAVDKLLEEEDVIQYPAWKYSIENECLVPTIIIYNEKTNTMYEFQEHCSEEGSVKYLQLQEMLKSFSFIE